MQNQKYFQRFLPFRKNFIHVYLYDVWTLLCFIAFQSNCQMKVLDGCTKLKRLTTGSTTIPLRLTFCICSAFHIFMHVRFRCIAPICETRPPKMCTIFPTGVSIAASSFSSLSLQHFFLWQFPRSTNGIQ